MNTAMVEELMFRNTHDGFTTIGRIKRRVPNIFEVESGGNLFLVIYDKSNNEYVGRIK